jgi:hypothetical protein
VEVAPAPDAFSVRDSKRTGGGELTFTAAAWRSLLLVLPQ